MSDLKMSDLFHLPLHRNGFYVESEEYRPQLSPVDLIDTIECCTAQEAEAVCHAINSHDKLVSGLAESQAEVERLRECLCSIQSMCIGELSMNYKLDACSIGQMISNATKKTHPELCALLNKDGE